MQIQSAIEELSQKRMAFLMCGKNRSCSTPVREVALMWHYTGFPAASIKPETITCKSALLVSVTSMPVDASKTK